MRRKEMGDFMSWTRLVAAMEEEAHWAVENGLLSENRQPDVFRIVSPDGLHSLQADAVKLSPAATP